LPFQDDISQMRIPTLLLIFGAIVLASFEFARQRSIAVAGGRRAIRSLHSLPKYYGYYSAIWAGLPALLLLGLWLALSETVVLDRVSNALPSQYRSLPPAELGLILNDVKNMAGGQFIDPVRQEELRPVAEFYLDLQDRSRWVLSAAVVLVAMLGASFAVWRIRPDLRARNRVEGVVRLTLVGASTIAIFTTLGIVLSVVFEAGRFFGQVPFNEFMFGLEWSPQTAIRADQVGSSGAFGAVPLFVGTLLISSIAMLVAVPLGLMIAIYLAEYAAVRVRAFVKPMLELLAGVPTVVYGYFAALTVAPLLRDVGNWVGLDVASESALGAGFVMGVMIIPFVSSLSDDVITAVPLSLRDGSLALGATRSETTRRVVLPAALPGIVGGVLLAVSRAIGETMIVVMAAGLAANLTVNPLETVTTVTVQIVTLLVGDQEFDSAKTLAAFALGLVLFVVTLALNVIALHVVRRYREQYE
jgi:phosphate transport system permease protein